MPIKNYIFVAKYTKPKYKIIMSATIRLFDEAEACTVYSIQFATNDKTEFDKFMEKFMNDLSY